jgi:hypothetical protein
LAQTIVPAHRSQQTGMRPSPLATATLGDRILLRCSSDGRIEIDIGGRTGIGPTVIGRAAETAPRLVRMLMPICGWAQGIACLSAIGAARGVPAPGGAAAARALLALGEKAVALVWHACLDWPPLAGHRATTHCLVYARKALDSLVQILWSFGDPLDPARPAAPLHAARLPAAALAEAVEIAVIPRAPSDASDADGWTRWVAQDGCALAALARAGQALRLPAIAGDAARSPMAEVAAALEADAGIARAPCSYGRPAEPCPLAFLPASLDGLARDLGPVGARFLATAVAAAAVIERLVALEPPAVAVMTPFPRCGLAQVDTVRGPLAHLVRLGLGGRIELFRSAPLTERMLQPDGVLARTLAALPADSFAEAARLAFAAFVPCAPVNIVCPRRSPPMPDRHPWEARR